MTDAVTGVSAVRVSVGVGIFRFAVGSVSAVVDGDESPQPVGITASTTDKANTNRKEAAGISTTLLVLHAVNESLLVAGHGCTNLTLFFLVFDFALSRPFS